MSQSNQWDVLVDAYTLFPSNLMAQSTYSIDGIHLTPFANSILVTNIIMQISNSAIYKTWTYPNFSRQIVAWANQATQIIAGVTLNLTSQGGTVSGNGYYLGNCVYTIGSGADFTINGVFANGSTTKSVLDYGYAGTIATVPILGERYSSIRDLANGTFGDWGFRWCNAAQTTTTLFVDTTSGNVGIGTQTNQNPVSRLEVDGTVTATSFSGSGSGLTNIPLASITGVVTNRVSAVYPLTNGVSTTNIAIAHGLGATPGLLRVVAVTLTNDAGTGFVVGQEIDVSEFQLTTSSPTKVIGCPFGWWVDSTNIWLNYYTVGSTTIIVNGTATPGKSPTSMSNFGLKAYWRQSNP
jgi:hypothetical protein